MITIIMSTYNGASYLEQQLNSILNQTYEDWRLLVRDDNSTDGTLTLLQEYAERYPEKIRIVDNGGQNLGVVRSFEVLLSECKDADYVQLADQDDVWLPEKLEECMALMLRSEEQYGRQTPVLVHCDLKVVDNDLKDIAPSFWRYVNIRPDILDQNVHYLAICNSVTGCATLINHAVQQVVLPIGKGVYMHDAWVGLKVLLSGGHIVALDKPLLLYRQHGDNVCGATPYRFTMTNLREKYVLAQRSYQTAHPLVFRNYLHFLFWKTCYFFKLHF